MIATEPFDLKPDHHAVRWDDIVAGPFYFMDCSGQRFMFQVNKDRVIALKRVEPGADSTALVRLSKKEWLRAK